MRVSHPPTPDPPSRLGISIIHQNVGSPFRDNTPNLPEVIRTQKVQQMPTNVPQKGKKMKNAAKLNKRESGRYSRLRSPTHEEETYCKAFAWKLTQCSPEKEPKEATSGNSLMRPLQITPHAPSSTYFKSNVKLKKKILSCSTLQLACPSIGRSLCDIFYMM